MERLEELTCPDCGKCNVLFNGGKIICENYCGFTMGPSEDSKFWWAAVVAGVTHRIYWDRKVLNEAEGMSEKERDQIERRIQSFKNIRADAQEKMERLTDGS